MPEIGENTGKKKYLLGVFLLLAATFAAKLIGLFYKIPLIRIVGVEGMAYFLAAYHIYSLLFVLSATGLPNALSLLVARAEASGKGFCVRRIFRIAALLFLSLGAAGTAALILFANPLAERLSMGESAAAIVAIAPSLLLAGWIGAARGYFQGRQNMAPTAVSEVLEAAGKLAFGLWFSLLAARRGAEPPQLAAAAILGITAGMCLAALYLLVVFIWDRARTRAQEEPGPENRGSMRVLPQLLRLALPMTVSASVMSLVSLVDTALISGRLQAAGFSPSVANSMYSAYGNLAVPLYNLVPSLLSPLSLALMPMLGAALARKDDAGAGTFLGAGVRLTALVSVPAALGLSVFARPVLSMIYQGEADAVSLAAPLLSLLALSVVPACFIALTGAALQASGHTGIPVVAMGAGALVKLLLEFFLLVHPAVGIYAAPISTFACNLTALCLQLSVLCRVLPFRLFPVRDLFRPFLAAVCGVGAGIGCYLFLSRYPGDGWQMLCTLALTVLVFLFLAFRFGAVTREDLTAVPMGEKISAVLEKCRLLPHTKRSVNDDKRRKNKGDFAKKGI